MRKCYIYIGIPTSGKSTHAKKQGLAIISCDEIRMHLNPDRYIFSPEKEKQVWELFYMQLSLMDEDFIIDNINCKIAYIDKIKGILGKDWEYEYVFFDIPLWKAYWRNVKRTIMEDKYIPFKVLNAMNINYIKTKERWKMYGL